MKGETLSAGLAGLRSSRYQGWDLMEGQKQQVPTGQMVEEMEGERPDGRRVNRGSGINGLEDRETGVG
jgi:hypothetical protein